MRNVFLEELQSEWTGYAAAFLNLLWWFFLIIIFFYFSLSAFPFVSVNACCVSASVLLQNAHSIVLNGRCLG